MAKLTARIVSTKNTNTPQHTPDYAKQLTQAKQHFELQHFQQAADAYSAVPLAYVTQTHAYYAALAFYFISDYARAEVYLLHFIAQQPHHADALSNLMAIYLQQQKQETAITFALQIVDKPYANTALLNNILVLAEQLPLYQKIDFLTQMTTLKPDFDMAYLKWINALVEQQAPRDQLEQCLARWTHYCETSAEAWARYAHFFFQVKQYARSVKYYEKSVALMPKHADLALFLAIAYDRNKQFDLAMQYFDRAMQLKPPFYEAMMYKAAAHTQQGDHAAAKQLLEEVVAHAPSSKAISLLLFALNYLPETTDASLYAVAQQYQAIVETEHANASAQPLFTPYTQWPWLASAGVARRIKIGFVSPDFVAHPVSRFTLNVLQHLKQHPVDIIGIAISPIEDHTTAQLKTVCHQWHNFSHLQQDALLAEALYALQCDILIDLAGHTSQHRLPVFAYAPAPIQITWIGYYGTTGLHHMHYVLTDKYSTPPHTQRYFTEQFLYLPESRFNFSPSAQAPEVSPLPAQHNGYITFGCIQGTKKYTPPMLQTWANILNQQPSAQLKLLSEDFKKPEYVAHFQQQLSPFLNNPHQIDYVAGLSYNDYLHFLSSIDILLDTFPFNGGTTTAEALWQGVPTITLAGDSMISRQGTALLHAAQLPHYIATSIEEYTTIALTQHTHIQRLATERKHMRTQLMQSSLYNGNLFAEQLVQQLTTCIAQKKMALSKA